MPSAVGPNSTKGNLRQRSALVLKDTTGNVQQLWRRHGKDGGRAKLGRSSRLIGFDTPAGTDFLTGLDFTRDLGLELRGEDNLKGGHQIRTNHLQLAPFGPLGAQHAGSGLWHDCQQPPQAHLFP